MRLGEEAEGVCEVSVLWGGQRHQVDDNRTIAVNVRHRVDKNNSVDSVVDY